MPMPKIKPETLERLEKERKEQQVKDKVKRQKAWIEKIQNYALIGWWPEYFIEIDCFKDCYGFEPDLTIKRKS
jgi:hypothetical protein